MTQPSSQLELSDRPGPGVPLSERPLVADDQQTVVRSPDGDSSPPVSGVYTPAGQELLNRLFPNNGQEGLPERGLRLAHFEVRERIASGGMGAVFLATDLELSRDVALKILHPGTSRDASLVARFRNEARACARLNHDNIARVYYTGQQDGIYFIAYEFADGRTIKDLIQQRGVLTSSETVNYAIQTTLALNHIFAAGIVHRDIKPSNIILTETGRVKVVDLGLARRESQDSIGEITVAGTTLGTFDYISPEQARDPRTADIRSDIYSLGCTMYHMLTGQPPYPEGTALQKLLDHQGKTPPDPARINRGIEPELAATVQKMMSTNPDHRYQDPGQLLADLMQLAAFMGLRSVPAEGIVWQRIESPSIRQVSGAVFLFGSVALICLAALIMHFAPQSPVVISDDVPTQTFPIRTPTGPNTAIAADSGDADSARTKPANDRHSEPLSPGGTSTAPGRFEQEFNESRAIAAANSDDEKNNPEIAADDEGASTRWQPPDESPAATTSRSDSPVGIGRRGAFGLASISKNKVGDYDSLRLAMAEAKDGDTILLRFNGIRRIPRDGLDRIMGRILTLKADEGFHPVLEFQSPSGAETRVGVFRLINNSTLTIEGVGIRLSADDSFAGGQWAVFDCNGPNKVVLRNVSLDVSAGLQPRAAIFRMNDTSGSDSGFAPTGVVLTRVIARGAADLLFVESQSDLDVQISDSGFGLDGSLLNSTGSASMNYAQGELKLDLTHVTCLLTQPLIRMQDSDAVTGSGPQRLLPAVSINSGGCVFASVTGGGTLVQSRGHASIDRLEELLTWTGSTNLFHGIEWFWNLESSEAELTFSSFDFDEWRAYWLQRSDGHEESSIQFVWNEATWHHQDGNVDLSEMTTEWLKLDEKQFFGPQQTRPRFQGYEIPGVSPDELPEFAGPAEAAARRQSEPVADSQ
ncbi:MAG: serine/threonine-protein kinase [Planctomycetaceae bacterium]